jgi:hypothetical protein
VKWLLGLAAKLAQMADVQDSRSVFHAFHLLKNRDGWTHARVRT